MVRPRKSYGSNEDSETDREENDPSVGLISNNMEARAEHTKTRNYQLLYGLTTAVGAVFVILTFVWCITYGGGFSWNSHPELQFNWHPLLMTFGMVFLFAQSMLAFRTLRSRPKPQLKLWHGGIHLFAFAVSIIGLKAGYDSHNYADPPKPNLYTLHSWLGLITVVLFTGQFVFGFVSFLYPGLSQTLRAAVLPVHRRSGIVIFTFAVVASTIGFAQKAIWHVGAGYAERAAEGIFLNFLGLLLVFFGVLALFLVNDVDYKRESLPEEEISLTAPRTSD